MAERGQEGRPLEQPALGGRVCSTCRLVARQQPARALGTSVEHLDIPSPEVDNKSPTFAITCGFREHASFVKRQSAMNKTE